MVGAFRQKEIDESGAGHFDLGYRGVLRQCGGQRGCQCARILARGLGQAHGDIAGEIAMQGIARVIDLNDDAARRRRHEFVGQGSQRLPQQGLDQILHCCSADGAYERVASLPESAQSTSSGSTSIDQRRPGGAGERSTSGSQSLSIRCSDERSADSISRWAR